MKEAMKLALEALIAATPVKAKDPQLQACAILALREALAEQPTPVQGWKLVPVEPTQKMLDAPPNAYPADALVTWKAMLAAAPQPAVQQEPAWRTAGGIPRFKPAQQEPVGDALYFAQWTADKKDLSDYVLVGSLSLAGIEDGEYGQSEIDSFENAIEALQEKLVTGADHKKVPLLAYIGALNSTSPQPAQRKPLTEPQKQALAKNWFAEDWAITKAIGMMIDYERLLGIKEQP